MVQLPYFYDPAISSSNTSFTLGENASRHCIQVLRMPAGAQLQLTNGKGNLYTAIITKADKKRCEVSIQDTSFKAQESRKTCVTVSLLKNANRFEWFIEKATEMGVQEIIPLLCERTERQQFRYERLQTIVTSAMLQSRQCWLPLLKQPAALQTVIEKSEYSAKLIAHCTDDNNKTYIGVLPVNLDAQILIGPEGDFTDNEIKLALKYGYKPVSLGNTRLRTETAAVVASALLIHSPKYIS